MIATIVAAVLGGVATWAFLFLLGCLYQQRKQVLEMRQTNVALFNDKQNLTNAYAHLKSQVEKIQAGPVAASISFDQVQQIAEITAAKLDMKALNGKEIQKKDVH